MAMHQMYSAAVDERNSLRDELIGVMEELQRVRGEHEQERENNPPKKHARRPRIQQPFHQDNECRNHRWPLSLTGITKWSQRDGTKFSTECGCNLQLHT